MVKRKVDLYDLDAIIAVGYRVSSKKATKFRIWATQVLRDHVLKGYSLNLHKLESSDGALADLKEALSLIGSDQLKGKLKSSITMKVRKELV